MSRDWKPENIMIDSEDRIKLIDFGIGAKAGASRLTSGKL
jgi:serine/threonine protein kinase